MEPDLHLSHPVKDLHHRELLPAGTRLTRKVIDDLVRRGRQQTFTDMPLVEYGTLVRDLLSLCQKPPYNPIFSASNRLRDLEQTLSGMRFAEPVLEGIARFKTLDPYTYRHMLVVFALALRLGQDLLDDPRERKREAIAAPTHDFGKHCVPLSVLTKEEQLSAKEQDQLFHHAAAGYALLCYYLGDPDHPAALTARDHHERCNGSGYPRGLVLQSRTIEIVAVCDVFDALVSPRPYRPTSYPLRPALEEVTRLAEEGAIHWEAVQILISCYRKEDLPTGAMRISRRKRGTPPADNHYTGVHSELQEGDGD